MVKGGRLALYMHSTSPKASDLRTDGRYALHCSVADNEGGAGEFHVRGFGGLVDDAEHERALMDAGFPPQNGFVLCELGVDRAFSCTYPEDSPSPTIKRWRRTS